MPLIDFVFPNLRTPKTWLDKFTKKYRFRGHFDKQHGKRGLELVKYESHHLYHTFFLSEITNSENAVT